MRQVFQFVLTACVVLFVDAAPTETDSYDYIVVGSGPGGGPLACDLARAGFKTLLLEAGDDQGSNPVYSELANFIAAGNDERTRWDFWVKHSEDPERELKFDHMTWRQTDGEFYVGLDPPEGAEQLGIWYPRAATLGGCAMHNGGVTALPLDADWNTIAERTGDDSWEASKMRQYLKKTERNTYAAEDSDHGFDGWMAISADEAIWANMDEWPATHIAKAFAEELGQDPDDIAKLLAQDILEPNADTKSSLYAMSMHGDERGRRSSPNNYIKATLADPAGYPLTVQLNSLVTKVLFDDGETPSAIGVEVLQGNSMYRADPKNDPKSEGKLSKIMANREVIVSGGAFNSPQILKLSGIGPAEELKKFDIPVVADSPGVGENLADNYEGSLIGIGKIPVGGSRITSMFRTPNAPTENRNIYAWCGAFSFEGFWPGFPTDHGPNQFECAMVHMNPKSQAGSVRLVSADPQDPPDINFRFYKNHGDEDLAELVAAANMLRKSWQAGGDEILPFDELHPCPGTGAGNCTVAEQAEYLKLQAYSHHATSSCSIGGDNDPMAVLDSKFRVRGVKNLRVVDASAFPIVPGAFPILPTAMISAKAAEEIIADAKATMDEGDKKKGDEKKDDKETPVEGGNEDEVCEDE